MERQIKTFKVLVEDPEGKKQLITLNIVAYYDHEDEVYRPDLDDLIQDAVRTEGYPKIINYYETWTS